MFTRELHGVSERFQRYFKTFQRVLKVSRKFSGNYMRFRRFQRNSGTLVHERSFKVLMLVSGYSMGRHGALPRYYKLLGVSESSKWAPRHFRGTSGSFMGVFRDNEGL